MTRQPAGEVSQRAGGSVTTITTACGEIATTPTTPTFTAPPSFDRRRDLSRVHPLRGAWPRGTG
jgi:hypothetical protein